MVYKMSYRELPPCGKQGPPKEFRLESRGLKLSGQDGNEKDKELRDI
jgi:hypothetical protein